MTRSGGGLRVAIQIGYGQADLVDLVGEVAAYLVDGAAGRWSLFHVII